MDTSSFFHLSGSSKKEAGGNSEGRVEIQDNGWTLRIPSINIKNDLEMVARELRNWHKLMHPAISQEERETIFKAFEDGLQFHLVHDPADTSENYNQVILTAGLSRRYLVVSTEALKRIDSWTEEEG